MWCKVCNLETTEKICPTCGALTEKDIDREVFGVSIARYLSLLRRKSSIIKIVRFAGIQSNI